MMGTHGANGSDIFQRRCPHCDPRSTGEDLLAYKPQEAREAVPRTWLSGGADGASATAIRVRGDEEMVGAGRTSGAR